MRARMSPIHTFRQDRFLSSFLLLFGSIVKDVSSFARVRFSIFQPARSIVRNIVIYLPRPPHARTHTDGPLPILVEQTAGPTANKTPHRHQISFDMHFTYQRQRRQRRGRGISLFPHLWLWFFSPFGAHSYFHMPKNADDRG